MRRSTKGKKREVRSVCVYMGGEVGGEAGLYDMYKYFYQGSRIASWSKVRLSVGKRGGGESDFVCYKKLPELTT